MPRTKVLELNIGDIVQMKKDGKRTMLIVQKDEKTDRLWGNPHKYNYVALDLLDGNYYGIYTNCNNKHYKVLA
jgi:hypothetical protein